MTSNTINNGGLSAQTMHNPSSVASDGTRLYVADSINYRILIWNAIPTANQVPANVVVAQPNMTSATSNNGGVSAQSVGTANSVSSDGTRLYVLDGTNSRALIWNAIPTTNGVAANVVLGQPNMTSSAYNNALSSQSMTFPVSIYSDGTRVTVSDQGNNRVLIWNTIPTTNGAGLMSSWASPI